jgi:hypothetical protein
VRLRRAFRVGSGAQAELKKTLEGKVKEGKGKMDEA